MRLTKKIKMKTKTKTKQLNKSQRPALVRLAALLVVVAFQTLTTSGQLAHGLQAAAPQAHEQTSAVGGGLSVGAGAGISSPLESSSALGSDDLIAAESSQAPGESSEPKAFTSGQMLRSQQEAQQHLAASVAPQLFIAPAQQQSHMAPARLQPPHKANFNPFMAAALAGNYGPAQQQIAAAALHAQQQGGQVGPPPSHHQHHASHLQQQQQQQQHQQHQQHQQFQQQHHSPHQQQLHVGGQHMSHAHPQQQPHGGQQQMMAPPMGVAPALQQQQQQQPQQQQMAVQESSVRHNVVPAPSADPATGAAVAAAAGAAVELNEIGPASQPQTGLAVASSVQHPVVAPAGMGVGSSTGQEAQAWPLQAPDIPKIVNLEVKCEKNLMKVSVEFDKTFNGVIFSKGHFSQGQCVHVSPQSNKQQAYFDISINSCGTQGNTQNGLYGMGQNTGSGTFFENTIVIQYDPNVQEVYDHARKLRCTWHDQYEKAVTFRPFPVDMLDIVRADFAGDNVGCWMQIQVGKGPWASEVAGIVKIGQTMTMVLAIKDEENKFDMLVRNCFAHDGKRGPIELVDKSGCITRPKLMSRFTKIKNFGSSATVLSYAHFQAFKFPDSMEVHFQCTIQICRHQCPEQCAAGPGALLGGSNAMSGDSYSESTISGTFNIGQGQAGTNVAPPSEASNMHLRKYGSPALSRDRRDTSSASSGHIHHPRWSNRSHTHQHQHQHQHHHHQQQQQQQQHQLIKPLSQSVGVNRVIQVVSTGDLAFAVQGSGSKQELTGSGREGEEPQASQLTRLELATNQICMSPYNFVLALVMLALVLLCSSMLAISLYVRQRSLLARLGLKQAPSSGSTGDKLSAVQQQQQQAANRHQQPVPSSKQSFAYGAQFYAQ